MTYTIRESVLCDISVIAPNMREADRKECLAAGHSPAKSLQIGFSNSQTCNTVLRDGKLVGMFGYIRYKDNSAFGWALGTDEFARPTPGFLKQSYEEVQKILWQFPRIVNAVSTENVRHRRWLEAMGAEFFDHLPIERGGLTFIPFMIARSVSV